MPIPKNINKTERTRRQSNRRVLSFVDYSQQTRSLHDAFGKRIKELREQANLTQEELAKLARIDRSYLAQIERGQRRLSLDIAYRLAKSLNFSIDEVLNEISRGG